MCKSLGTFSALTSALEKKKFKLGDKMHFPDIFLIGCVISQIEEIESYFKQPKNLTKMNLEEVTS